jgi:hypothetical protein
VITLPASLLLGTTTIVSLNILTWVLRLPTLVTYPCSPLSSLMKRPASTGFSGGGEAYALLEANGFPAVTSTGGATAFRRMGQGIQQHPGSLCLLGSPQSRYPTSY